MADGAKRPKVTDEWITDMDRMIRLDGRDPEQAARVIRWLATDETSRTANFWRPNIRSPRKLRSHWDQMMAQYKAEKNRPTQDTRHTRSKTVLDNARRQGREEEARRVRSVESMFTKPKEIEQ